jgi:hypothetical protein
MSWEHGVCAAARYRVQYEVSDPGSALGPKPEPREQQRDWEWARQAVERCERQLGREITAELGRAWDLEG